MNPEGAVYLISDLHLGVPDVIASRKREREVLRFLDNIVSDASELVLLGDVFDFWFEYKHAVPRGHVRLLGALARLADQGMPIHFFKGNHDLWTFGYLEQEIGLKVYTKPQVWERFGYRLYLAHGDGLGPGDYTFKFVRKLFHASFFQWCYARIHPNSGIGLAGWLSRRSRAANEHSGLEYLGHDREWLMQYCTHELNAQGFDYMIFGHRHLPLRVPVPGGGEYINLGDWVRWNTFARISASGLELLEWNNGDVRPVVPVNERV